MSENKPDPLPLSDDDLLKNAIPIDGASEEPEPIELEEATGTPGEKKIRAFGDRAKLRHEDNWARTPNTNGQGAIHMRTFVAKLRLDAIEYMDNQINEWLDAHPQYEVKIVTTTVGQLTGKITEPALFVTVWV